MDHMGRESQAGDLSDSGGTGWDHSVGWIWLPGLAWQVLLLLLLLLSRSSRVRLCATPRWQPTRLPRPWDSPGKNTGVGCHFLLQCMKVKSESEVAQSCPTLASPWTAAYQAPPSMAFSRQEYWSGVPLPSPKSAGVGCYCLLPVRS